MDKNRNAYEQQDFNFQNQPEDQYIQFEEHVDVMADDADGSGKEEPQNGLFLLDSAAYPSHIQGNTQKSDIIPSPVTVSTPNTTLA